MDELEHTETEPSTEEMIAEFQKENEAAAPTESQSESQSQAPAQWQAPDWAQFDWNGKRVAPDSADKARIWLSQGYNYSQRMNEFNQRTKDWEKTRSEWEPKIKRYEEVDKFIQQNPDWWKHVESSWQNRAQHQAAQVNPDLAPVLQPIQEKLGQFEQFMSQLQQEREAKVAHEQDQALERDIEAIRTKYPNIDLSSVDASGETLELRILKHANQTGIPTFRAAFHDYLSDHLMELARADGREAVAKTAAAAKQKGILGQTQAPTKALNPAANIKAKSYDALMQEALAELGIN